MATYSKEYLQINEILKDWNPIGVPEPALFDEYIGYIPSILEKKGDEYKLLNYLEGLLINVIGVDYNPKNQKHKQDVLNVITRIQNV